jgi:hypothetical protein
MQMSLLIEFASGEEKARILLLVWPAKRLLSRDFPARNEPIPILALRR